MKFDDTKKIFESWKNGINNRLDEMFVPELSEEEVRQKEKEDNKVLLGEEEPEDDVQEESVGKAAFNESEDNLEETVRAKIREAILGVVTSKIDTVISEEVIEESVDNNKETLSELNESIEYQEIKTKFKKLLD
jgi:hypothetical protein